MIWLWLYFGIGIIFTVIYAIVSYSEYKKDLLDYLKRKDDFAAKIHISQNYPFKPENIGVMFLLIVGYPIFLGLLVKEIIEVIVNDRTDANKILEKEKKKFEETHPEYFV